MLADMKIKKVINGSEHAILKNTVDNSERLLILFQQGSIRFGADEKYDDLIKIFHIHELKDVAVHLETEQWAWLETQDPPRQQSTPPNRSAIGRPYRELESDFLRTVFRNANKDGSGVINQGELQQSLSNGTLEPFNPSTIRLMIEPFDKDHKGTLSFQEFSSFWKYLGDWQQAFQRFDKDNSGTIDKWELKEALISFGYKVSDGFIDELIRKFDRTKCERLNFDDYIQLCLVLQSFTATFRKKDSHRAGIIRITFEDYLSMVTDNALVRLAI